MLVDVLISDTETRGAPRKHNSLEIERWCRKQLERNNSFLTDAKNLRAQLIDKASDWQGRENWNLPARTKFDQALTDF